MGIALVTTISSMAMPAAQQANFSGLPQDITPTPAETDLSQAGSTDGIVWMGIAIAAIILLPVLANGVTWQKQQ